jgi:hypothetical protein
MFYKINFLNCAVAIDLVVNHIQEILRSLPVSPTMNGQRDNRSS